ncbi:hypothetical protein LOC67_14340 [Stieleria sp. JC731]|uniref:hypothetical protein n=1 Tax=Pirellulaceae TaxID=2691357 RepID=UPI001E49A9D8|nr:hypothetical protein [Stieleria sp. JC731]MCC9601735.1 hypothetical protein [Stieleria sp. JC731]
MKRFLLMSFVSLVAFQAVSIRTHADKPQGKSDALEAQSDQPVSVWMEKKLQYSQAILRGLATSDFDSIRENARSMGLLSRVEGFVRGKNADYRTHVRTFSQISKDIETQAELENIEGVAYAFNRLAISCVECHKTLRQSSADEPVSSTDESTD